MNLLIRKINVNNSNKYLKINYVIFHITNKKP